MKGDRKSDSCNYAAFSQNRHDVLVRRIEDDTAAVAVKMNHVGRVNDEFFDTILRKCESHPPTGLDEGGMCAHGSNFQRLERRLLRAEPFEKRDPFGKEQCEFAGSYNLRPLGREHHEGWGVVGEKAIQVASAGGLFELLEEVYEGVLLR